MYDNSSLITSSNGSWICGIQNLNDWFNFRAVYRQYIQSYFLPESIQLVYHSETNYQESSIKKVKGLLNAPGINRRKISKYIPIM